MLKGIKKGAALLSLPVLGLSLISCDGNSNDNRFFTVKISNIGADAFETSTGSTVPAVFAPGTAVVHLPGVKGLFVTGEPASEGLEILAEDGGGDLLAEEAYGIAGVASAVTFAVPDGETEGGPLTPGNSYTFIVEGEPGDSFNFASMFVQSNDLFIAPKAIGIDLFDENGDPRSGDITSEVVLWDAGTEVNEEPGVGENQAPRQAGPNTGADENGVVRLLNEDDFPLPDLASMVTVTLTPND